MYICIKLIIKIMAKTKAPQNEVVFLESENVINDSLELLKTSTIENDEVLNQTLEVYKGLQINGINDIPTYAAIEEGIKKCKKIITEIPTKRKEITKPAYDFIEQLIAEEKRLIEIVSPVRDYLINEKQRVDDARKIAEQELFQTRSAQLLENGFTLTNDFYVCGPIQCHSEKVVKFTDEEFEFFINEGLKELERKRKADEEAVRLKNELEAEKQKLQEERLQLQKEMEEMRQLKADLEAQKSAIEKTYDTVVEEKQSNVNASVIPETAPTENLAPQLVDNEIQYNKIPSFIDRAKKILSLGYTAHPQQQLFKRGTEEIPYKVLHEMEQQQFETYFNSQAGNIAPEPEPIRDYPTGVTDGFNLFKIKFIKLMQDETIKYTRQQLIEWAEKLTL